MKNLYEEMWDQTIPLKERKKAEKLYEYSYLPTKSKIYKEPKMVTADFAK